MSAIRTEVEVEPEIIDLVPHFLKARREDIDLLQSHFRGGRLEEMARICHTIKGIARPYGFPSLENLAVELERECKENNSKRAAELLNKMESFVKPYIF